MIVAIRVLMVIIPSLFWLCLWYAEFAESRQEALGDLSQQKYLSQKGIHYRLHRQITMAGYRRLKLTFGLAASIGALLIGHKLPALLLLGCAILAFFVGYGLPAFYFWAENRDDNRKMLRDIHNIYDTLRVYLAVDAFITDALEECYRRVAIKRLKTAIYELKEGLRSQSEQLQEIEAFRLKFDNPHINQLANLLSQYYRSGNVDAMMGDLSEQMVAIDHAINLRKKEWVETKGLIKEVLVLLGMLGGIAVALLTSVNAMMDSMF